MSTTIVTGGAGFIGSNLLRELNRQGITDLMVVDDLTRSEKFRNLADLTVRDYMDKTEFRRRMDQGSLGFKPKAILHNGACSDTMEDDGRYLMENNFGDSKSILHYAVEQKIPLVYASSAAVYGRSTVFEEKPAHERPLNAYGYSKLIFDQHVRQTLHLAESTVVGLRYFNVYGPREDHKGRMMSVLHQLLRQIQETGTCRLFSGTDGFENGEQVRDFVFVGDIVDISLFFAEGPTRKGIFNAGTGQARSFNDIARTIIHLLGKGVIEYIPFPESLRGKYQSHTQACVASLREAGYTKAFTSLEEGIQQTLREVLPS